MQKLPIGISEFSELREQNCLYVDKTKFIYSLIVNNRRTFLSRPRRFGKSLLVSSLEAALQGKKELFEGLWIATTTGILMGLFGLIFQKSARKVLKNLI